MSTTRPDTTPPYSRSSPAWPSPSASTSRRSPSNVRRPPASAASTADAARLHQYVPAPPSHPVCGTGRQARNRRGRPGGDATRSSRGCCSSWTAPAPPASPHPRPARSHPQDHTGRLPGRSLRRRGTTDRAAPITRPRRTHLATRPQPQPQSQLDALPAAVTDRFRARAAPPPRGPNHSRRAVHCEPDHSRSQACSPVRPVGETGASSVAATLQVLAIPPGCSSSPACGTPRPSTPAAVRYLAWSKAPSGVLLAGGASGAVCLDHPSNEWSRS